MEGEWALVNQYSDAARSLPSSVIGDIQSTPHFCCNSLRCSCLSSSNTTRCSSRGLLLDRHGAGLCSSCTGQAAGSSLYSIHRKDVDKSLRHSCTVLAPDRSLFPIYEEDEDSKSFEDLYCANGVSPSPLIRFLMSCFVQFACLMRAPAQVLMRNER
ncbi:hypothetical protein KP509_08G036900 [Ceratopteris richardii]|uniref:Uncharacterized protein n=1 Tax=Ceratopteris richardii TaxID=49495 RepID=A0A8T2U5Z1_CERRI|nr:hypothetical protein KP509_08G036900 [Ceratopteris richardii]